MITRSHAAQPARACPHAIGINDLAPEKYLRVCGQ